MQNKSFVPFTKEMKKDYTILVPNMLPIHFKLIISVLETYGYNMELLDYAGPEVAETGLKYTHNDTCYPAILVVGQFIHALKSGKYDPHKTALIMFQTGGGCRASNYISLIRKALEKAGYGYVPVISFSMAGIERHPGFHLSIKKMYSMLYAVLYGDLIMSLVNQTKPYEAVKGTADSLAALWTERLGRQLGSGAVVRYSKIKETYKKIIKDFDGIPIKKRDAVKVGIVGEIYVKYSPLANNSLEQMLIDEGAEPVVPGLLDFCLYIVNNVFVEYRIYGRKKLLYPFARIAYKVLCDKKDYISRLVKKFSNFNPWVSFDKTVKLAEKLISTAVKMGEGWLLTGEMLELAESGCTNIVCTQPFGCLPNHICGKGMMKPLKEYNPNINVIAIDYDAGASRVNQENRIKLMLFNALRTQKTESVKELITT
ncbi:MAG: 2-hydroxyacyl-CoA dehydratase [Clostridia bacterium]|nr:2-hydroxyacyl-CoA dehydratase [Clostridia bacterium]